MDALSIVALGIASNASGTSNYNELTNKPKINNVELSGNKSLSDLGVNIPAVNNATLTIQKNGTNVGTFTANQSTAETINITVPTQASDIGAAAVATTLSGYGITDAYTKTEINGKLSGAMHFKGTLQTVSDLPSTAEQGDMYNISDTGANYAWDGSSWDKLSENIDLSGYVPTSRTINGKALSGDITLNASDVSALPDSTVIPTKVSDLANDSGYITAGIFSYDSSTHTLTITTEG